MRNYALTAVDPINELAILRKLINTPLGADAGVRLKSGRMDVEDAIIYLRRMLTDFTRRRQGDIAAELEAALDWIERAAEIDGERYPDFQALVLRTGRQYVEQADTRRRAGEQRLAITVTTAR